MRGFAKIAASSAGVVTVRSVASGVIVPAATSGTPQSAALFTLMDFSTARVQTGAPKLEG
jgi:hypothetical protein